FNTSRPIMSSPQSWVSDGETKTWVSTTEVPLTTLKSRGSAKAGMAHRAASSAIAAGSAAKRAKVRCIPTIIGTVAPIVSLVAGFLAFVFEQLDALAVGAEAEENPCAYRRHSKWSFVQKRHAALS